MKYVKLNSICNFKQWHTIPTKELKDSGVAECINEEVRKGRLYRLTDVGQEIVEYLVFILTFT